MKYRCELLWGSVRFKSVATHSSNTSIPCFAPKIRIGEVGACSPFDVMSVVRWGAMLPSDKTLQTRPKRPPPPEQRAHAKYGGVHFLFVSFAYIRVLVSCHFKTFFKYFPVCEFLLFATCSGVPFATTCPPPIPPSGPISMI